MTKQSKKPQENVISLTAALSRKTNYNRFALWIVGDTPLITNAWSEKAKREMLQGQVRAVRGGKEIRNPEADFLNSLYDLGVDEKTKAHLGYGFPTMGIKNAILSVAHKDRGVPKTVAMSALWLDAEMIRARPALSSAICDMPITRIYGGDPDQPNHPPICREDMVKVGVGLNRKANLAYRAQFTIWAMKVTGKFNADILTAEGLAHLIMEAGLACGIGEWRNERRGMFGAFHMAFEEEEKQWEAYAARKGGLPIPESYKIAAE